jgi:prolyl oligopeptidase
MVWVRDQNEITRTRLTARPEYSGLYRDALTVLESSSRIPEVEQRGPFLYNLWRDHAHPRGIFRRVSIEGFRAEAPAWETVLDVDALAASEGKLWAFGGAIWRRGDNSRCLIRLAPLGGDAVEIREFNLKDRAFVPNGFFLPTAKSRVTWIDGDSWFVGTDFGPGSLTASGYPSVIKLWRRGTPLAAAEVVLRAGSGAVGVGARHFHSDEADVDVLTEEITFWEQRQRQLVAGRRVKLQIPETARIIDVWKGRLVIWLKSPGTIGGAHYGADSVVIADTALLRGEQGKSEVVVEPSKSAVINAVVVTPSGILVRALDNVRGRVYRYVPREGGWTRTAIDFPDNGAVTIQSTDEASGDGWIQYESFLTPPSLYRVAGNSNIPEKIKSQSPTFDASRFEVKQFAATSADGTRIPYFVVQPRGLKRDGTAPVWMFSYGGFEIALTPAYSGSYEDMHGAYGKLWLERGGVFVLANIRGGGEFGPAWHQAAVKENHYKAFEDFEAVARDIAARKITSAAHIGIEGRSNGGLLVSATMVRHPELYGAVVCGHPLIDMSRYSHLLAGASWMGEYGNPDVPKEWAFISKYSPYQNVRAGMKLPPVLFYTTTHDDRVPPSHARKMAAKMEAMGYAVDYAENTEGGHHGSVTSEELATRLALTYTFLWAHLR